MQALDRKAISGIGIPGIILMENAGNAVLNALISQYPDCFRITIICGKGNNGGDGYVLARKLANYRKDVLVFCLFKEDYPLKSDAGFNLDLLKKMNFNNKIMYIDQIHLLEEKLKESDIIVDSIFGTGFNSSINEPIYSVIEMINNSGKTVLSMDIASGIDGNTGQIFSIAVKADLTVTFAYPKIGHYIYPGKAHTGRLIISDIGIPEWLLENEDSVDLIEACDIKGMVIPRENDSHKGDYGHLCVIGGSRGKAGAVMMTGLASLKSGAGLLTIAAPDILSDMINIALFEGMVLPLKVDESGFIHPYSADEILDKSDKFTCFSIGPGLGVTKNTSDFLFEFLIKNNKPVVMDADALNIASEEMKRFEFLKERDIIFTPHPGELARFFNEPTEKIKQNIIGYAVKLSTEYNAVVVCKGSTNIIADRAGKVYCIEGGGPQLAKGGSGDVLTGIIGALLSNGYSLINSALIGVYIHKLASELSLRRINNKSLIARELIDYISEGFCYIESL